MVLLRDEINFLFSVAAIVENTRKTLKESRKIRSESQNLIEQSKALSERLKGSRLAKPPAQVQVEGVRRPFASGEQLD